MVATFTSLAQRVRSIPPPAPAVRWLRTAADAEALRKLIRACYGQSYSYTKLYQPGGLESAWKTGTLISLGEHLEDGSLRGHTGFWAKDASGHALESGLSLVDPQRRREARTGEKEVWSTLCEGLAPLVSFVHQHTTTLHPMAQRYALRHMHARPSGLIPFYACGESVLGLEESGADMHALCMTTRLRPGAPLPPVYIPKGRWRGWLGACAEALGVETSFDDAPSAVRSHAASACDMETLEVNDALGLRRRRASHTDLASKPPPRRDAPLRVELIHVAATAGITDASKALGSAGFMPCGIHLCAGAQPHEIVFVHVEAPRRVAAAVRNAKLATPELRRLWNAWPEICEHTS